VAPKISSLGPVVCAYNRIRFSQTINFDNDTEGQLPKGFSTALTGRGKPENWVVMKDETAPSKPNVLAQTDMDKTSYRFPVCVLDSINATDVDVSVKFKPVKGNEDQAAGIVWRYKDKDNYYIVRANANEDNVVLYKVEKGRRTDLPLVGKGRTYDVKDKFPSGEWGTLHLVTKGNHFEVYHNDKKLFEVQDSTFTNAGTVEDAEAIAKECPEVGLVSPGARANGQVVAGNLNWSTGIIGTSAEYPEIRNWKVEYGEYFTDQDVKDAAKVCVLGRTVADILFPDMNAVGKNVRILNVPFKVIGIFEKRGQSPGADQDDDVFAPYTTVLRRLARFSYLRSILVYLQSSYSFSTIILRMLPVSSLSQSI